MWKIVFKLLFVFFLSNQLLFGQNLSELQRENDSLRFEIRLGQIQQENRISINNLNNRLEGQDRLLTAIQNQTSNWITFIEVFFAIVAVIIGLFAFFGFRQIKQYTEMAKHDQQELEKMVSIMTEQQNAIRKRHEELQQFKPDEILTQQNKKVLEETISEAKQQLEKTGFDALKNFYQAKAIKASDKKDWSACLRYCENYLDFDEMNADMWHRWGRCAYENNNMQNALKGYDMAINLNPTLTKSFNNRAIVYAKLNKNEEALADYNKAIELNPQISGTYSSRGALYMKMGKEKETLDDMNLAIELDPKNAQAYTNRARLKLKSNKMEEALDDHNNAIKSDPNYGDAYNNRGVFKVEIGLISDAILDYNKALELDPENPIYLENKKIAESKLNDNGPV
jgi:tetratricopeptide (TPR) repeat protein